MYLKGLLTITLIFILSTEANVRIFKQWRQMDFQFPSNAIRQQAINNGYYVPANVIPIDVAVDYRGNLDSTRVFVTMPRFTTGVPASLGYTKSSSLLIEPYPSYDWHSSNGKNCDGITSVFRVAFDGCNQMWVLDTGKIGNIQYCQPQLLIFNLISDKLVKRYRFDKSMYVDNSLFITPILDVADPGRCSRVKAYIADVTGFGLIVYDCEVNKAWRVNNKLFYPYPNYGKFTIAGESFDLMDGLLALTIPKVPLRQDTERSLLFHALASGTENAVPLRILNNATIWENDANAMADEFKVIGTRGIQTGAQAMDKNGNLYFVLLNPLAIVCWDSSTSYKTDNIKILHRNDETMQFASGVKVVTNLVGEEELWLVTNRLQKFMTGTTNLSEINYRVHVANIKALLNFKDKCNGPSLRDDQTIVFPDRNLFLVGSRDYLQLQQFTHFMITADAINIETNRTTVAGPKRVGRFQLFGDALTKFYESCVNTVSEADDFPKTEVQTMWVAPAKGSGCVRLSAMIYEGKDSWYSDVGGLTKIICEEKVDKVKKMLANDECCACDEAKYSFVFEGIWSNETHPKDYPFAIWLTHFSDIVGASHDANFSFWGENHIATDGFRSLAEWGSPRALEEELRAKGSRLRTLVKAGGLWFPNVNANTSSHFRVDRKHHKVSLVSMFGPSPDWVVGVSGLNLCRKDCTWEASHDIDLYPWDSGTDSGISYMSPNAETQPRERMHKITTKYPEDPRAPFYNPNSDKMTPLAKLYIRREKVITRNCDEELLQAQIVEVSENDDNESNSIPECEVSEFSAWSPCSVTCGKGLRERSRRYRNPQSATEKGCNRQLIYKEMCVAAIPECGKDGEDSSENLAESQATVNEQGEGLGLCRTTQWTDWSECSATCGVGISMRTRTFVDRSGRKKCPHISIVEKTKCMMPDCKITDLEIPDSNCPVAAWSDWSPCSTTCGKGVQIRTRLLLVEPNKKAECMAKGKELNQQRECSTRQDCTLDFESARTVCNLPSDNGACRGSYKRFFYNPNKQDCEEFEYGGCRGNQNNFLTRDVCLSTCGIIRNTVSSNRPQSRQQQTLPAASARIYTTTIRNDYQTTEGTSDGQPVDCLLSEWSEWSTCSAECDQVGVSTRTREVIREPQNNGQSCGELTRRKRCRGRCT